MAWRGDSKGMPRHRQPKSSWNEYQGTVFRVVNTSKPESPVKTEQDQRAASLDSFLLESLTLAEVKSPAVTQSNSAEESGRGPSPSPSSR